MRLSGREHIAPFHARHKDARAPLAAWERAITSRNFRHFPDLKGTFGSADYVKPHTVFDIAGNKYRLISLIAYAAQLVRIEVILTHAQYDKGAWRK